MSDDDAVRRVLAERGCPEDVVRGGLAALVQKWEAIVRSVEDGYPFGLDDLLNDMDIRDAIAAAAAVAPAAEATRVRAELAPLDARLRHASVVTGCLWGEDVEDDDGLDPGREWWYYLRPARLSEELADELAAWGLLDDGEATE
ncbi:MAG: hypothetical protein ABS52_18095 [Gemmatimonadetes bacterium SCN 70-22]|nr:MAG: hypothetical protein ABS52_18095 [Gemmatimonadetes bacterium SCN 70-22]